MSNKVYISGDVLPGTVVVQGNGNTLSVNGKIGSITNIDTIVGNIHFVDNIIITGDNNNVLSVNGTVVSKPTPPATAPDSE